MELSTHCGMWAGTLHDSGESALTKVGKILVVELNVYREAQVKRQVT